MALVEVPSQRPSLALPSCVFDSGLALKGDSNFTPLLERKLKWKEAGIELGPIRWLNGPIIPRMNTKAGWPQILRQGERSAPPVGQSAAWLPP